MICGIAQTPELTVKLGAAELGNPYTTSMQFHLLPLDGQSTGSFKYSHQPHHSTSEFAMTSPVEAGDTARWGALWRGRMTPTARSGMSVNRSE
jgi:hypothetical protein